MQELVSGGRISTRHCAREEEEGHPSDDDGDEYPSDDNDDDSEDDPPPKMAKKPRVTAVKTPAKDTAEKPQTIKSIDQQIASLQAEAARTSIRATRKPPAPKRGAVTTPITVTVLGGRGSKADKKGGTFSYTFVPANTTVTLAQFKAECRAAFGKVAQHSIGSLYTGGDGAGKPLSIADMRDGMSVNVSYRFAPGNPQPMGILLGGRGGGFGFGRRRLRAFGFGGGWF